MLFLAGAAAFAAAAFSSTSYCHFDATLCLNGNQRQPCKTNSTFQHDSLSPKNTCTPQATQVGHPARYPALPIAWRSSPSSHRAPWCRRCSSRSWPPLACRALRGNPKAWPQETHWSHPTSKCRPGECVMRNSCLHVRCRLIYVFAHVTSAGFMERATNAVTSSAVITGVPKTGFLLFSSSYLSLSCFP